MAGGNGEDQGDFTKEHPTLARNMPFTRNLGHSATLSVPRILEMLIVAAVTAAVTVLSTMAALSQRLENVEQGQKELKAEIRSMRSDLYRPRYNDGVLRFGDVGYDTRQPGS